MTKPTKYQRWWMGEMLKGKSLEYTDDGQGVNRFRGWFLGWQRPIEINARSADIVYDRGWIKFDRNGIYILTPAGRKAIEE